jgi:hypothetical protein
MEAISRKPSFSILTSALAGLVLILGALPLHAAQEKSQPISSGLATAPQGPETALVGIYLFDLRDLSPAKGTFTCDFWIWSQSKDPSNIISDLQFINAERVVWYAEAKPEAKGLNCIKRRGTGTFRMGWRLKGYPYDSQTLPVQMEYTLKDSSKVELLPDTANSGVSLKNFPVGWKLSGFELAPGKTEVSSNLGDPNLPTGHGEFSLLQAIVKITRTDTAEYWGLISSAWVAAVMMLVSYFMDSVNPASRYALLGAALFATVISLRSALAGLGDFGTRVDQFHLIVIGYIIGALVVTLGLNTLSHRKVEEHRLRVYSALGALFVVLSFIAVNLLLMRHHA